MASSRQTVHGLFWSVAERVASQGMAFVVLLLLARLLGPQSYGLVTLAATIALFGQMLLGETFSQALIQEKTIEPAQYSSVFWLLVLLGMSAAIGQFFAAPWLADVFGQPTVAPVLEALSPLLLLSAIQAVPTAMLRRALNFRAVFAASTIATLAGGAIAVTMALRGFGVWSLIANLLVQNTISTVAIWRKSGFNPARQFSRLHLDALWFNVRYAVLGRLAAFAVNQGPRLIVGYLFGPVALGTFNLGLRIIEMLYQLLVLPATNVILPLIVKIRDIPERLENTVLSATHMTAVLTAPVYLTLAVSAPLVIPLMFGEHWLASVPLVQILCFYGVIIACGQIWQVILTGLGRPDIALRITIVAAIANIGALLLSAHWGPVAAAGAFVFRGYATLPFMPLVIARLTGLHAGRQYRLFVPILIAAGIMAVAEEAVMRALAHRLAAPLQLAAVLGVGAIVYCATLYALDRHAIHRRLAVLKHLQPLKASA